MFKNSEIVSLISRYGPVNVPSSDTIIGRSLATYGEWAQLEINAISHFIKEGDTALDIGACFGTHSLAFSELVGTSGRVIAFEASPRNFAILQRNCRNTRRGPIKLMQVAVTKSDEARFVVKENDENCGATRLEKVSSQEFVPDSKSEQISLSLDSLNLLRVNFIKIDVEGMESDVMSGALETLRRCKPIIFFEVNAIQGAIDTLDVMKQDRYVFFGLVSRAFNPDNFLGVTNDIFAGGSECGILAIPQCRYGELQNIIRDVGMASLETADDIALLLLNKPQYAAHDITKERAARTLKVPAIIASVGAVGQLRRELEALRAEKSAIERKLAEKSDVEKKLAETRAEKLDVEKKLTETHAEKSDIEKKLAKTHAEKLDAEKKLAEAHAEKLDVEKKLAETRAEKSDVEKKLEPLERELDRLNALLIMAQQLARRASKFPFSIYFRTKRKYRIILRSLRSGWVSATRSSGTADAQAALIAHRAPLDLRAPPIGNPALADLPPSSIQNTSAPGLATQTEPHPGGFKAESLAHLRVMKPPEFVKTDDLHYGDEPLLSAPAIHDAMRKQEKSTTRRRVILSFSHDHYAAVAGGTQLCVGIEEQEARANDFDYLHVHPLAPLQSLAPASVADLPFLRLTLNGDVQGICTYNALRDATVQLRETGIEQFVIIHHLLGHAIESVSEIIQATGRRQCWFWLHDFFSICVSPHLLRNGVSFCGAPQSNSAGCGICAFGAAREPHQKRISSFFEENDVHIIAPSAFIADLWRDKARLRHATLSVKPHVEIEWMAAQSGAKPLNRPARVAFIGVPTLHKGWPHFRRLVEKYRQDNDYDFLYFGVHPVDLDIPHFSVNVSKDNKSAMTDALREAGVDIVLHISPTPESFSFTTLEALASGAFVVTNASSGNTARLIARMGRGLVLDHESDIDIAFDRGDILMLAMKAQEKRTIETSKVTFSQMTIPFLRLESE